MQYGATELLVSTDAGGSVKNISVLSEDPKGFNFGHAAVQEFQHVKFIPGFRNGQPVPCTFTYTTYVSVVRTWHGRLH